MNINTELISEASTEMLLGKGVDSQAVRSGDNLKTLPKASVEELRKIDRECLSWGDTVHYQENPIFVSSCQGGLVFDNDANTYIDTGMWHSSCNFGYRNPEIESERHRFVYSVDGLGLLLNMVFADERGVPYRNSAQLAAAIAQDNDFTWLGKTWRMILQTGGYDLNVLKFAPYLDISYEEIDRTIGVLDQVLQKLGRMLSTESVPEGGVN